MMVTFGCPDEACDEGEVTYELDAGVEGDCGLVYGTRVIYEGAYETRTCGAVHRWTAQDEQTAWDLACATYRDDER